MSNRGRRITGLHERVRVEGPDARKFLDGLLSQDLEKLEPDRAVRSFLLTPQGKIRSLLWVAGEGEQVDMFTDAGIGGRVASDLAAYKIRVKAIIGQPEPVTTLVGTLPDGAVAAPLGETIRGFIVSEVDLAVMTTDEWTAMRLQAGEPVMDVDIDDKTIPQETGLVDEAVSFTKGCYLGQELVARLDSRGGRVNRHLRRLLLASSVAVPAPVTLAGDEAGELTSAATTTDGLRLGMGMLHRRVEPGAIVNVAGVDAEVIA
ncbi:MAG: CAF17-like 4Fe-4S cluster assembly/insertion protein YgfZ [Actinomycetota bacterium]